MAVCYLSLAFTCPQHSHALPFICSSHRFPFHPFLCPSRHKHISLSAVLCLLRSENPWHPQTP